VRAISLATGKSWDATYQELSNFARAQAIMPDDVLYIDEYLNRHFTKVCDCEGLHITVEDFLRSYPYGVYLITMAGHITCGINGEIYDTFDPSSRFIWEAYQVK
jgi:hypothetical protein